MERLKDMRVVALEGGDSSAATLAALVVASEPLVPSAERRARVLARVLERRRWRRSLVGLFVRPAFAVAILLLVGITTAAATVAPRLQLRTWDWFSRGAAAPVAATPAAPSRAVSRRPIALRAELAPVPAPRAARPHVRAEDPSRLVEAVRALRIEDDPARAERLALAYLRIYPRGALTEEALAVAIEAGARRQDARTDRLAERYLRTYPDGRFRRLAGQALQRTP
ncbi:MAG TPA: hypothetical protein VHO67_24220 [Polyangia bacterium]|nr:hypothetical protein [Polyangia bacterium]